MEDLYATTPIRIKCYLGNEICVLNFSWAEGDNIPSKLLSRIHEQFGKTTVHQYVDNEDDRITVKTEEDLQSAVDNHARFQPQQYLRIFLKSSSCDGDPSPPQSPLSPLSILSPSSSPSTRIRSSSFSSLPTEATEGKGGEGEGGEGGEGRARARRRKGSEPPKRSRELLSPSNRGVSTPSLFKNILKKGEGGGGGGEKERWGEREDGGDVSSGFESYDSEEEEGGGGGGGGGVVKISITQDNNYTHSHTHSLTHTHPYPDTTDNNNNNTPPIATTLTTTPTPPLATSSPYPSPQSTPPTHSPTPPYSSPPSSNPLRSTHPHYDPQPPPPPSSRHRAQTTYTTPLPPSPYAPLPPPPSEYDPSEPWPPPPEDGSSPPPLTRPTVPPLSPRSASPHSSHPYSPPSYHPVDWYPPPHPSHPLPPSPHSSHLSPSFHVDYENYPRGGGERRFSEDYVPSGMYPSDYTTDSFVGDLSSPANFTPEHSVYATPAEYTTDSFGPPGDYTTDGYGTGDFPPREIYDIDGGFAYNEGGSEEGDEGEEGSTPPPLRTPPPSPSNFVVEEDEEELPPIRTPPPSPTNFDDQGGERGEVGGKEGGLIPGLVGEGGVGEGEMGWFGKESAEGEEDLVEPEENIEELQEAVAASTEQQLDSYCRDPPQGVGQWKKGPPEGKGAHGTVYKCFTETGRVIAVKEFKIAENSNSAVITALVHEIALMKGLKHENLVRFYGVQRKDPYIYIFMELMSDGSVAKLLATYGAFRESVMKVYIRQILHGLQYLHNHKVVHRDIKGANILVSGRRLKLADFGCSRIYKSITSNNSSMKHKTMAGTVNWMAPEIIKGTGHGRSVDIWSLGCTIIEMATGGHPPYSELEAGPAMWKIAAEAEPIPFPPHLSPEAKHFLELCFIRDPCVRAKVEDLLRHPFLNDEKLPIVGPLTGVEPLRANAVPPPIILKIFSYLSFRDLVRLSSVCKSWRALASDGRLWAKLWVKELKRRTNEEEREGSGKVCGEKSVIVHLRNKVGGGGRGGGWERRGGKYSWKAFYVMQYGVGNRLFFGASSSTTSSTTSTSTFTSTSTSTSTSSALSFSHSGGIGRVKESIENSPSFTSSSSLSPPPPTSPIALPNLPSSPPHSPVNPFPQSPPSSPPSSPSFPAFHHSPPHQLPVTPRNDDIRHLDDMSAGDWRFTYTIEEEGSRGTGKKKRGGGAGAGAGKVMMGEYKTQYLTGQRRSVRCVTFCAKRGGGGGSVKVAGGSEKRIRIWSLRGKTGGSGIKMEKRKGKRGGGEGEGEGGGRRRHTATSLPLVSSLAYSHSLQGHTEGVTCLDSWDDFLLSGSHDSSVRIWSLKKKKIIKTIVHDENVEKHPSISSAIFLPAKSLRQYAYATSSGVVNVVDIESGSTLTTFSHRERVTTLSGFGVGTDARADSSLVFTGSSDGVMRCWDLRISTHNNPPSLSPSLSPSACVRSFSLDPSSLSSLGGGGKGGRLASVCSVSAMPWCAPIVSASSDGLVHLWDLSTAKPIASSQIFHERSTIHSPSLTPSLFLLSQTGHFATWDFRKLHLSSSPSSLIEGRGGKEGGGMSDGGKGGGASPGGSGGVGIFSSDVNFGRNRVVLGCSDKSLRLLDFSAK